MSNLITAKEAFALSNFGTNIDRHVERIDTQIKWACQRHDNRISCLLDPCSGKEAVKIAAQLRAAGYCFKWRMVEGIERVWFDISWGG